MLNHQKLLEQIEKFSSTLFFDRTNELVLAKKLWNEILLEPTFATSVQDVKFPWILPSWDDDLANSFSANSISNYSILAIDGSQIYPDRHQGTSCYLINIGITIFLYDQDNSSVKLNSTPYLFTIENKQDGTDIVDCKREELEFQTALDIMLLNKNCNNSFDAFLFDGSLIFWHLESKSTAVQKEYLEKYLYLLDQFYKNQLLIGGYISLPKSKELVNIIRAQLFNTGKSTDSVDNLLDTHIVNFNLIEQNRTILFKNHSPITKNYPNHLHPYFFYLNIGTEIVRIEIPFWIAKDKEKITKLMSIVLDQCAKGYGYPISLSEAHEQAVVKGHDRDLFYRILQKLSVDYKQSFLTSQKSIKKRFASI